MDNFFSLFGLPEGFDIDLNILEKKYFELQKVFHPDKLVGKSDKERIQAIHKSGEVNDGYKTLKNPLSRAEYLLKLKGIIVNGETGGKAASPELLMEAMEQRESLDAAEGLEEINQLTKQNENNRLECVKNISAAFLKADFDKAADLTIKLKYLEKFADEIRLKKTKGLAHAS